MDTSDTLPQSSQPMEIDSLPDHAQQLSRFIINWIFFILTFFFKLKDDLDLLQHSQIGHDLLMNDALMDSSPCVSPKNFLNTNAEDSASQSTSVLSGDSMSNTTQILKTSSGQFVILQPNQNSLPMGATTVRVSNNPMFSSTSKPIVVNSNQLNTTKQVSSFNNNSW